MNRAGRRGEERVSGGQSGDDMPVSSSRAGNLFYRFSCFVLRSIFRINGGLNVIGKRNIPPEGGVILASNHISYLDPPLMAAALPRRATFIARKGLFGIPVLAWYIRHYAFPVDRERPHPSTIKDALRRLKRGELIVMFPEGRRSETGELLEGKRGIGMIAKLGRAVIVPALIVGSDKALAPGKKWLHRARISVIFGRPLEPPSPEEEDHRDSEEITRDIMGAIAAIKERHGDIRS